MTDDDIITAAYKHRIRPTDSNDTTDARIIAFANQLLAPVVDLRRIADERGDAIGDLRVELANARRQLSARYGAIGWVNTQSNRFIPIADLRNVDDVTTEFVKKVYTKS